MTARQCNFLKAIFSKKHFFENFGQNYHNADQDFWENIHSGNGSQKLLDKGFVNHQSVELSNQLFNIFYIITNV
jgi:hypothetical protein